VAAETISNQYIVVFKDTAFSPSVRAAGRLKAEVASVSQSVARTYGSAVRNTWSNALTGMAVRMNARAAATMAKDPRVLLVEPDRIMRANTTQNSATWGLDRVDQRALPLTRSYTYNTTASVVTAYIIDTGIRTTHTEFGGRAVWGTNTSGDGNNTDCHGHGTHVAGTVGGAIYGVAKGVALVAVKVLNCAGSGSTSGVISGIDWVIANKHLPALANMSLGGGFSASLNAAVARGVAAGVTFVVAAGNENTDACSTSPASAPAAITVGATTNTDGRSSFSNRGTCLDIFAPGSSITSAVSSSDTATATWSGTSMASPHTAGAAALYLSGDPGATPAEVAAALSLSATSGVVTDPGAGSPNRLIYTLDNGNTAYLTLTKVGSGAITSTPSGIDCGSTCQAGFAVNTPVTLAAVPSSGFEFSGWSGACTGTGACALTMSNSQAVTATFVDPNGSPEVFPASGVWPLGWTTPSSSNAAWNVVTQRVREGQFSLQSGAIGHNQNSGVEVTGQFSAGTVTFDWTVSSEANFDFIRFYVDGQQVASLSGCAAWSTSCWRSISYSLSAGMHTLKWTYTKDGSVVSGSDAGWIDNAQLPAFTQIAPPAAPLSLTATATASTRINLAWVDNSSNETGFKVERGTTASGPWSVLASPAANVSTFSDAAVVANSTYYYRVLAYNVAGNSAYTSVASATTPDCSASTPIAVGNTLSGNLASTDCRSTVRTGSYYDNFGFTAAEGTAYTIRLASSAFDTYLFLLDSTGRVVASNDDSNGTLNSQIVYTPSAAGSLTLHATSYAGNATGAYTVSLSAGSTCTPTPIAVGAGVSGIIATTDCRSTLRAGAYADNYSFTATTGRTYTILLNSSAFDTYLFLQDSGGRVVAANDDSNGTLNSQIVYTAAAAGTFTVHATTYGQGATGAYTVQVR
jgi:subtilisin family serine protease